MGGHIKMKNTLIGKIVALLIVALSITALSSNVIANDTSPITDEEEPQLLLFGEQQDDWYITCVSLSFVAPPRVPVDHYEYRLDQNDWTTYTPGTMICDNGGHFIQWKWIDTDGRDHVTSSPSVDFKIDNSPPTIDLNKVQSQFSNEVTFTAVVSDSGSGVDYVEFYLNGALVENSSQEPHEYVWDGLAESNDQVYAIAYDKLGYSQQSEIVESSNSFPLFFRLFEWLSTLFSWLTF